MGPLSARRSDLMRRKEREKKGEREEEGRRGGPEKACVISSSVGFSIG